MRSLLEAGLAHYQISADPALCENLLAYIALLQKWNRAYNLTAVTDPEEMLRRHVFDSLAIHAYIQGQRCLDVGTGPGLPGLILALVQTNKQWTLLDSNLKKIRFLRHVKSQLNMDNINVIHARVESFSDETGFSTIVCRAFSSLSDFHQQSRHLLQPTGVLLAMKANITDEELLSLQPNVTQLEKIELDLFEDTTQRCLIRISD